MKVRSSLRKICAQCVHVKRGRKQFIICSSNPRHKQRQGFATLAGGAAAAAGAPGLGGLLPATMPAFSIVSSVSTGLPALTAGLGASFFVPLHLRALVGPSGTGGLLRAAAGDAALDDEDL
jgi:large subunit ribosomal protein L36